jgi:uncharacterized membrane protein
MTTKLIKPSWWYLLASLPLAGTYLLTERVLATESYKYRIMGGLRPVFVLISIQLPSVLGLLALIALLIFLGSALKSRLHEIIILKIFSIITLFTYGLWGLNMIMWIMMK